MILLRLVLALALLAAGATPAWAAAPAFDNKSNTVDTVASGTTTLAHTFISNTNGAIAVCVLGTGGNLFPTGVTVDGNAMTKVSTNLTVSTFRGLTLWVRKSADIGTGSKNIVATFAGGNSYVSIGAVSFTDVDQTTPLSNGAKSPDSPGSTTSISKAVTNPSGSTAIDCVGIDNANTAPVATQTQRWSQTTTGAASDGTGQSTTTGVNPTMGWSWSLAGPAGILVGSMNPVATTTGVKHKVVTEP